MAVVGSATIVVRAITTNVADDIKKGFAPAVKQADKAGEQMGKNLSGGINRGVGKNLKLDLGNLEKEAAAKRKALVSLIRTSNVLGPAIAGVGAALGSLGGTLISLVGILGRAIPAVATLGGAFATLGVAAIGAKVGLGGVFGAVAQATEANTGLGNSIRDIREELQQLKFDAEDAANAEKRAALELEVARENLARVQDLPPNSRARREAQLAYEEADLAFRRAKDRAADLQEQNEKGILPGSATGGAPDPFAELNASQRELAEYLVTLRPLFQSLENEISKRFVPSVITGIQRVENELLRTESFEKAVQNLGTALGDAADNFFNTLMDSGAGDNVVTILNNMSTAAEGEESQIAKLGTILANVFGIISEVLIALDPVLDRFFGDVEAGTGNLLADAKEANKDGSLAEFFDNAYTTAERLFGIVGNLMTGFRGLFTENEDGAETLLSYLEGISENFAALAGTPAGDELAGTINRATENGTTLLSIIGDILGKLLEMGGSQDFADGLAELQKSAPDLSELFDKLLESFPELMTLVTNIIELSNNLTDSGTLEAFFTTLNDIVEGINDFLGSPPVQKFIAAVGPILSTFNAIALVGTIILNMVLLPILSFFFLLLAPIASFLQLFGLAATRGEAFKMIFKGIGFVIKKIFLGIGKLFMGLIGIIGKIGLAIKAAFIANPLGAIITVIALVVAALVWFFTQTEVGKKIWAGFVEFIKGLIDAIVGFFVMLGDSIRESWNRMVENIGKAWDGFVEGFQNAIQTVKDVFKTIFNGIGDFFKWWINGNINLIEGFVNFFIDGLNWIISKANELEFEVPDWVPFIGGETLGVNLPTVPKLSLPRLAEGGIVTPTPGGQLVTVAEAGKPERVEPLDPSGLSNRDRAIIDRLSGGRDGGGNTINVYGTPGMDTKELAEEVSRRIAFKVRKGTF